MSHLCILGDSTGLGPLLIAFSLQQPPPLLKRQVNMLLHFTSMEAGTEGNQYFKLKLSIIIWTCWQMADLITNFNLISWYPIIPSYQKRWIILWKFHKLTTVLSSLLSSSLFSYMYNCHFCFDLVKSKMCTCTAQVNATWMWGMCATETQFSDMECQNDIGYYSCITS